MKKFLNLKVELKAIVISSIVTVLSFLGTMFLFWFNRYDIPFGVLAGGGIVAISWLILYFVKGDGKEHVKVDIFIIFARLVLMALCAFGFALLQWGFDLYIISAVSLVISYLATSLLALLAFIGKDKECSTVSSN